LPSLLHIVVSPRNSSFCKSLLRRYFLVSFWTICSFDCGVVGIVFSWIIFSFVLFSFEFSYKLFNFVLKDSTFVLGEIIFSFWALILSWDISYFFFINDNFGLIMSTHSKSVFESIFISFFSIFLLDKSKDLILSYKELLQLLFCFLPS